MRWAMVFFAFLRHCVVSCPAALRDAALRRDVRALHRRPRATDQPLLFSNFSRSSSCSPYLKRTLTPDHASTVRTGVWRRLRPAAWVVLQARQMLPRGAPPTRRPGAGRDLLAMLMPARKRGWRAPGRCDAWRCRCWWCCSATCCCTAREARDRRPCEAPRHARRRPTPSAAVRRRARRPVPRGGDRMQQQGRALVIRRRRSIRCATRAGRAEHRLPDLPLPARPGRAPGAAHGRHGAGLLSVARLCDVHLRRRPPRLAARCLVEPAAAPQGGAARAVVAKGRRRALSRRVLACGGVVSRLLSRARHPHLPRVLGRAAVFACRHDGLRRSAACAACTSSAARFACAAQA